MAWITPKTNWVSTDKIFVKDLNRIIDNLVFIKNKLPQLAEQNIPLPENQNITGYPYASILNKIASALETINDLTYNFDIGETKTYIANGHPFDYAELNRIETYTQKIYLQYVVQVNSARHLAYRMGESKWRAVPRVQYAKDEPIGNRLEFRLGSMKGVTL